MAIRTRAEAFDEWMRRFIDNPAGYEREFETVQRFLEQEAGGKPTTYGAACAAYLTLLERGEGNRGSSGQPGPAPAEVT